jgi:predicted SnoaL-like aldol condensation-catalyzing enzyme
MRKLNVSYWKFQIVLPHLIIITKEPKTMNTDLNKKNAMDFYKTAYLGKPKEAVEKYVGKEYIQHNPAVANGTQGFIYYFDKMQREYPEKSIEFLRCIAEGDLVALHPRQIWPRNDQYVTMDFFRFDEAGKICEHWDSIQQVPQMQPIRMACFSCGN